MRRAILAALALAFVPEVALAQKLIEYTPPTLYPFMVVNPAQTAIVSSVRILLPDGTAAAPSLAAVSYPTTGIFWDANPGLNIAASGGVRVTVTSSYIQFFNTNGIEINNVTGTLKTNLLTKNDAVLQLGIDAATAVGQTFRAPDSTGANVRGGDLTLRAGDGTNGNATGGNVILGGGANAGAGERGAVLIEDGGTKPTCASAIRGAIWYDAGAPGVLDTLEVCRKDAANNYAWVSLF